ncbi:hypothetical protein [Escherichia coli]|uniref:hypothetical protein n=1 Tax=Escherichia coli TaxID=562 RepID=UPI001C9ADCFB|nr:hypothetical protein [Escherichia coli]MBY7438628.1 hypothetical protein [Escherichia coli]
MKELLNTTISRRDAVTTTAKLGAAVALSNAITLPFSTTVRAETSDTGKTNENGEPAEFGKNRTLRFSGHP